MPMMNGTELTAKVKALRPEIPIVLMSGYGPADLLARGLEATHGDLLTKPFSQDRLLKVVDSALHRFTDSESPHGA